MSYLIKTALDAALETGAETLDAAPVPTVAAEPPQPTASEGVHPLAVSPEEGLFAVSQEGALKGLQKLLTFKYTAILTYINYGDRLRAHFRDSIYNHFQEHLREEREDAYALAVKITALGGEPEPRVHKVVDVSDLHQIFICLMQLEKELISTERDLLTKVVGENVGLKMLLESMVLRDQSHLDDARRMLLCEG